MTGFPLVSSDSHVSEPADLWTKALPEYGSRVPHLARDGGFSGMNGDWMLAEGIPPIPTAFGNVGGYPPGERGPMLRAFDFARDTPRSAFDPEARLEAMTHDGVDAEMIYGTYALRLARMPDVGLQRACMRVSNEWLAGFCRAAPGRLFGLAALSSVDPSHAAADLHEALGLGLKGAFVLALPPPSMLFSSSHHDRLWAAAQEADVPISLHGLPPMETYALSLRRRPANMDSRAMGVIEDYHLANMLYDHPIQAVVAQLILSGVFERFPRLKLVLSEWGTAWIPAFLDNLDATYATWSEGLSLSLRPSEYFLRNVWCTFDRPLGLAPEMIERFQDRLMWASDFPHVETTWPESPKTFAAQTSTVPDAVRRKLAYGNIAQLYRVDVPPR